MSHNLTIKQDGTAEFAFIGDRDNIWHGLGHELKKNEPLEVWKKKAGLDWTIERAPIKYFDELNQERQFDNKYVLYRSDTKQPLSIVSNNFKIVQPDTIIEFFRNLVYDNGMTLSTAGTLFGGTQFWALAETNCECEIFENDTIKGHLLVSTGVDNKTPTIAKFVSIRVVCSNTMDVANKENTKNFVRKTHLSIWDNDSVKIDMNLMISNWSDYIKSLKKLKDKKLSENKIREIFYILIGDTKFALNNQPPLIHKKVEKLMDLYHNGAGAEYGKGTGYGVLQAMTNHYTHGNSKTKSHKFINGFIKNETKKENVMRTLLTI